MAIWAHSRNAVQTLINDLRRMSGDSNSVQMTHKEDATIIVYGNMQKTDAQYG